MIWTLQRLVVATMLGLVLLSGLVYRRQAVTPAPAFCASLENAFLRWLYGCPNASDGSGGGGSGAG